MANTHPIALAAHSPSRKRVAVYTRVSTHDQTCELQLRDLRAYCDARNLTIVAEYVDIGVSGAKDSRPELNRLMADGRKRHFDVLMVWAFDRFARSTKHLLMALDEFKSLGIQFISYQQNIDTSGPFGEFFFTVVAAFGQLERAMIIERVRSGISNARAKGQRLGRPPAYIDVSRARRLRAAGKSWRSVSVELKVSLSTLHRACADGV